MIESQLTFGKDDGVTQLCEASQLLIDEAIGIFSLLNVKDFSLKELNNFANTLLRNIDNTSKTIDALAFIPNEELIKCRLQLQQSIDKLYVCLTNVKNEWQNAVLLAVLKQKSSPNEAQTRFISGEYITILIEPLNKTKRYSCTKCL